MVHGLSVVDIGTFFEIDKLNRTSLFPAFVVHPPSKFWASQLTVTNTLSMAEHIHGIISSCSAPKPSMPSEFCTRTACLTLHFSKFSAGSLLPISAMLLAPVGALPPQTTHSMHSYGAVHVTVTVLPTPTWPISLILLKIPYSNKS